MKKLITHSIKALALLLFLISYSNANAQVGNFNITVENVTQTAANKLEFDVYLFDTDPVQSFELASCQLGFLINSNIYSGGALTVTINNSGSGLNAAQQFTATPTVVATLAGYPNQSLIRLAAGSPVSAGSGTIISTTDPGTLMTHFIVTSSVNFAASTTPDLAFTSSTATVPLYATRVAEFISSLSTSLTVTPGVNALVNGNPTLNPPIPDVPVATAGSGATCSQITSNWSAAANATSYRLDASTSNTFGSFVSGFQDLNVGNVTTYPVSGLTAGTTYYYRLRAVNSFGTSGNSNVITYATSPAAPATPGAITGLTTQCAGSTGLVYSISTVTNATTYTWSVPTGWAITSINGTISITVTAGSAGQNGNISVTAGNSCGTSTPRTLAVTVASAPATPGVISGNATQCPGLTGQVYSIGSVSGATTYSWTVPTGWSVTNGAGTTSITVTSGSTGQNGNISVTAGNSCGTSSASNLPVTVSPATPSTPGAITGTSAQCSGQTSQTYSISSVPNATTYAWIVPTGWTVTSGAGTTSIAVTTGSAGQNGNISVTAGNSCGISSASTLAVTVISAPATPGTITGTTSQCASLTGQIYSIASVSGAISYTWTVPSGWAITAGTGSTSITVTTGSSGQNGNIGVTAGNLCGTSTQRTLAVTVNPGAPSAPGSITGTATQCSNQTGQIYSIGSVANAGTYTWTVPTGWNITAGAGSTSITVTTGSAGQNGNISVTAGNGCGTSSPSTLAVTVNPATPATPGAISGTASQCAGLVGQIYSISSVLNATTYTWTAPSGWLITAGAGTTSISVTTGSAGQNGNISVTAGNTCGTSTPSTLAVTVNPAAPSTPGTITGTSAQCAGTSGQIYSIASVLNATIYTWTVPAGWSVTAGAGTTSITVTTGSAGQNGNISVTAGNGCGTSSASILTVTVVAIPSAPSIGTTTQPTCVLATGSVDLSGLPATGTWTLTRNPGGITSLGSGVSTIITGLSSGTYSYTVTNATGCLSTASGNVVINAQPITPVVPAQTASISSGGTFIVTPIGGTIPAGTTYTWAAPVYTGGVTGGVAQGIPQANINGILTIPSGSGTAVYTVIPTSLAGCIGATFTVTVTVSSTCVPVTIGTQPSNTTACATSGLATFTVVAAGSGPFTYQWQYYNTGTSTWANVVNGTPAAAVYTNATTAAMSVTGITTPSTYQYRCYITNCSGGNTIYSNAATLTINAPPVPTLTSSDADNIFCYGTSVTFTASGAGVGGTYDFRINGATVQLGPTGTYTTTTLGNAQIVTVVVTNSSLCSATSAGIANFVNQPPYITSGPVATCATNFLTYSVVLSVSAGTVTSSSGIAANTGGNNWSISGILAGVNVTLTITDINGCIATQPVTAPNCLCPVLLPPVSGGDRSYCSGGVIPTLSATVVAGGNPKTVDWYNTASGGSPLPGGSGSLTYTPSAAGTYYAVTREIVSNCISSTRTPIILTMNPLPVPTLVSSDADNIFCSGTSVTFSATGGTGYNFFVGGISVQNGAAVTYTTTTLTNGQTVNVIVTNADGCTATAGPITNTVNLTPVPTLTSSDADNSFCLGTNVTFTASGGTNYNFRVDGVSVQNGLLTTYSTNSLINGQVVSVIVSNTNGCAATSTGIPNSVFESPIANAGTGGNNCGLIFHLNGSLTVGTGTWSQISGPVGSTSTFSPNTNTANAIVTVTDYGSYTFGWTVVNGTCSSSATVTVVFIQQPPANAGSGGDVCGKSFTMNAPVSTGLGTWAKISGPGNAVFTPDNHNLHATVVVDQFGSYNFELTLVNSTCTSTGIIKVVFHDLPPLNAGRDTAFCKGGSVRLKAVGTGTVSWTPVALVDNPNIINPIATPVVTTTFTVNLTDQYGCKNSDNVVVEVRDKVVADAGPDQVLGYLFTATMDANLAHTYEKGLWSLISGTGKFSDSTYAKTEVSTLSTGINKFQWTVTNGYCPVSRDTVMIEVTDFIIPTLITPNMDGKNDYFVLRGLATLGKTELVIFDRRGAMVYKNMNYDNSWNGVDYNKNPLPDDTYFYVIKSSNGKSISGYIVIRR